MSYYKIKKMKNNYKIIIKIKKKWKIIIKIIIKIKKKMKKNYKNKKD